MKRKIGKKKSLLDMNIEFKEPKRKAYQWCTVDMKVV